MRTFDARYPGTCPDCGDRFSVGDPIGYDSSDDSGVRGLSPRRPPHHHRIPPRLPLHPRRRMLVTRKHWVKDPLYYRGLAGAIGAMAAFGLIVAIIGGGWPYSLIFIPLYVILAAVIATWPFVRKFGWRDNK